MQLEKHLKLFVDESRRSVCVEHGCMLTLDTHTQHLFTSNNFKHNMAYDLKMKLKMVC